jgi:hypothetical protein
MENLDPIDVQFLINSQQVKQDAAEVRKEIGGTADAIEKATSKASDKISKDFQEVAVEAQTATNKLVSLELEVKKLTDANKLLTKGYDAGTISQDEYLRNAELIKNKLIPLRQEIKGLNADLTKQGQSVASLKPQFNGLGNSINQISRELPAFTFSAQTGFLAISNNLPILVDEINRLKVANAAAAASGAATIPVWTAIRAALFSWMTVITLAITALTLFGPKLFEMAKNLFSTKKAIDDVKASQEAMNKAFEGSEVKKAIQEVSDLKTNLELAKDGLIDQKTVIDQYNESIGKVAGEVKTLNELEKAMVENADAYVKASLYKAAADASREETANKLATAIQEQLEAEDKVVKAQQNLERAQKYNFETGMGQGNSAQAAQIAFNDAKRDLDEASKNIEDIAKSGTRIDAALKKLSLGTGLNLFNAEGEDEPKKEASILDSRQQLLDKIAALDAEYARKRFTKDEEEIQALRDKFAKVRELVERFNNDPRNKAKRIDVSGLDASEEGAVGDLTYRQQTANMKAAFEEQKKLYERYAKAAADFGIQEADRRFAGELDTASSYLEKLQEEYNKITAAGSDLSGPQTERLAFINAEIEKEQAAQNTQHYNLLKSLQDYNTKRELMIEEHILEVQRLRDSGDMAYIAEAERKHQEEIDNLDIAQVKKLEVYERFFKGVDNMSTHNAKKMIADIRNTISQLRQQFPNLSRFFDDIETKIGETEFKLAQRAPAALADMANGLRRMAQEVGQVNAGLGNMIGLLSEGIGRLSEVQRGMSAFSAASKGGDTFGAIAAGAGVAGAVVGGIMTLTALMARASEKQTAILKEQLEFQRRQLFGELEINRLIRERAVEQAKIEGNTLASLVAQREEVQKNVDRIKKDIGGINEIFDRALDPRKLQDLTLFYGAAYKEEFARRFAQLSQSLYDTGETVIVRGGFLGMTKEIRKVYASLAGMSFEEIENLSLKGQLTEDAEKLFQELKKLKEEGIEVEKQLKEIEDQMKSILTGGATAGGIADAIIEGFRNGKRAVEDFGSDVEDILQKAILSGFKYRFLEAPLNALLDQLFGDAQSGEGLNKEEIDRFVDEYNKITAGAVTALEQLEQSTGISFAAGTEGSTPKGLTGAIRRELTEATGSELAGLFRGFYDVSKRGLVLNENRYLLERQHYEAMLTSINHQAAISENTMRTADKVTEAVTELKIIVKQTKPVSGRDLGVGGP